MIDQQPRSGRSDTAQKRSRGLDVWAERLAMPSGNVVGHLGEHS